MCDNVMQFLDCSLHTKPHCIDCKKQKGVKAQ